MVARLKLSLFCGPVYESRSEITVLEHESMRLGFNAVKRGNCNAVAGNPEASLG